MQVNRLWQRSPKGTAISTNPERHIRGGMATKEKYEHEHLLHACQRAVS